MRTKLLGEFIEADKPNDRRFQDVTGRVFGRLTAVSYAGMPGWRWNCLCACGNKVAVPGGNLKNGTTRSCGCLHSEVTVKTFTTHSETRKTTEYRTYCEARQRCRNPSNHAFADYGDRGIEFRFDSYQHFLEVLGRKPTPTHTLDRIDNSGHYEPGNVRWATMFQQARNKRNNRMIALNGESRCQAEWAEIYGISPKNIDGRRRHGWCDTCAVTVPLANPGTRHTRRCPHRVVS